MARSPPVLFPSVVTERRARRWFCSLPWRSVAASRPSSQVLATSRREREITLKKERKEDFRYRRRCHISSDWMRRPFKDLNHSTTMYANWERPCQAGGGCVSKPKLDVSNERNAVSSAGRFLIHLHQRIIRNTRIAAHHPQLLPRPCLP